MNKKFKIVSLGCRTNQYEAQGWRDQLTQLGYHESQEEADLCIVNTCTVTQTADKESRSQVKRLAKQNPNAEILVTGCAADGDISGFTKLAGVKRVEPNISKDLLLKNHFNEELFPEFSIKGFEGHTRAFVKVQDGCNSYCSYCIIPYVRGRSRSRSVDSIVKEVEDLIQNGYKEIVLTGINIGDFDGGEKRATLAELVRIVDEIPGLKRLRLSSIDPDEVDDALLRAIIEGKNTAHSMHIVLQSGSNVVLKRMRRKYTKQIFLQTIYRLKEAAPDFTFTTDLIVGFPGETDRDHQDSLELIEEVKFAKVHMFPFSVRERTRAARMTDFCSKETIDKRRQEVLELSERVAFDLRSEFIGQKALVLTESDNYGHTDNFLPVKIEGRPLLPNQLIQVRLEKNSKEALFSHALID